MTPPLYRNVRPEQDDLIAARGSTLAAEEAAELFLELLGDVQRAAPAPKRSEFDDALRRGSYTRPSNWTPGLIRKPSKPRR